MIPPVELDGGLKGKAYSAGAASISRLIHFS
ncbi:MAG: hypothetical protein ACI8PG_002494, partial [Planctomycetota bacterium]